MKKILLTVMILVMASIAFGQNATKIQIYYFHAKYRCEACLANETLTKKVVKKQFKKEIRKKMLSFESIDLSDSINDALLTKYDIMFPTLLILKKQGDSEVITNYTDTAFEFALSDPEKYKTLLQAEIRKLLYNN